MTFVLVFLGNYRLDFLYQGFSQEMQTWKERFNWKLFQLVFFIKIPIFLKIERCYFYCFISTFKILFLRNYRINLCHRGLNRIVCTSAGGFSWQVNFFVSWISNLIIQIFQNEPIFFDSSRYTKIFFSLTDCKNSFNKVSMDRTFVAQVF